ncbi:MAG: DUF4851 domain-containing protein [Desulfovibrio sp.]|nr:DUF4851 domain-containing protein [Desulfovibrio sp.]
MLRHRQALPLFPLAFVILAAFAPGCAPRRMEAFSQGLAGSGMADFSISVAAPLTLTATGKLTAEVPGDDSALPPSATLAFALFGEGDSGQVNRHAHIIFSELPMFAWRWEKETWGKNESMLYATARAGGKNWTIQIFPVIAKGDWFSDLWHNNKRQSPQFWLAKRWSATPQEEMRLLAEYREPAPSCVREILAALPEINGKPALSKGKELRRRCPRDMEEFSARADASVDLEKAYAAPAEPLNTAAILPKKSPDMSRLVGRSEMSAVFIDNR